MSEKRDNSHWFIILAIIIIILIAIAYSSVNTANYDEREAEIKRRNEEEQKLVKEIDELNTKLEIYTKHESKNAFTEEYLKEICEKRYHQ
jgi:peptidoglycan hydrolase CwlO-like protein